MTFKKHEKEFMAIVTSWAAAQGYNLHMVQPGKRMFCYHWIDVPGGVIMCRHGKNGKEALWHACIELHATFRGVMAVILPSGQPVLGCDISPHPPQKFVPGNPVEAGRLFE